MKKHLRIGATVYDVSDNHNFGNGKVMAHRTHTHHTKRPTKLRYLIKWESRREKWDMSWHAARELSATPRPVPIFKEKRKNLYKAERRRLERSHQ